MSNLAPRQLDVLDRIRRKPELEQLFFKKARGLVWFDALNEKDYFNPHKNPVPTVADEGTVYIMSWPRWITWLLPVMN